jgi:NAD(P)-dependent dehydrogenase (short-subunit alcohol dehydrogenase family)
LEIRLDGEVAVVTGGGGILCGAMAKALARAGARVAVLDFRRDAACAISEAIRAEGGQALPVACDVLDKAALEASAREVERSLGAATILVNGAGGNKKEATVSPELDFFDLPLESLRWVFDLNLLGTMVCSQVFGRGMARAGRGNIVNISSMSAFRPLTRVPAYCAAKAAVTNFTQWLATHVSQNCSPRIRVNAIAPGFFLTEQNRFLLTTEKGDLTSRGKQILDHTPMGRFGVPDDLLGTLLWLVSEHSAFVHGAVIPVDGGFAAYAGV